MSLTSLLYGPFRDEAISHDQNFKNLILDYPRQALAFFAQGEAAAIDERVRVTPIRQEQLQERLGERFRELDVPLLVEWPDGEREAILFALEEESAARRFSIHRLAHYCLDLAELFATERVVPVVIFLRRGEGARALHLGGERHRYLAFHYLACELASRPSEAYWESDNLVARLNLPNMRHTPEQRVDVYAQAVRGLLTLEPNEEKQLKYLDFVDIYAALDDNEREDYRRRYPDEVEKMSTFAQRFTEKGREEGMQQGMQQGMEQGMQQGMEQGMQQGMQKGEATMLLRQMERKYGAAATAAYRSRVEQADSDTLLEWSDRVLTAETIEQVFH